VTDHDHTEEPGHLADPGAGPVAAPGSGGAVTAVPAGPAVAAAPDAEPASPSLTASTPTPAASTPAPAAGTPAPVATAAALDLEHLASLVYQRLGEKIEHPAAADTTPSVEQAVLLRERAPELYDLWLKIAQEKAATGNYVQRAPYEVPERLAQSGRPRALSAMIVVLAFCGYLAWLGGPGPYIGGLIAILDLLIMLCLFFGLRPDRLTETGRARKRRLAAAYAPADWLAGQIAQRVRPGGPARPAHPWGPGQR